MKCNLCGEVRPDADSGIAVLLDHLRVMHPDEYGEGVERWPDGAPVIYDDTLDPSDFGGSTP